MSKMQKQLSRSTVNVLNPKFNTATCYKQKGDYDHSTKMYQEVLAEYINRHGELHPIVSEINHFVALCYTYNLEYVVI